MKKLSANEIRDLWLKFWKSKEHEIIKSKSLIPVNDPSLLWINSGVATLKDYFIGIKKPNNPRLTNSQKCIRTNDIDNVGVTSRHHTLFEMLGNFSIGEYFKKEAIEWGYEFLFDVLEFDKDKIYITVFKKDNFTYNKWMELGIDESHLIKSGKETNFWEVGEGPCGPDTEIFFDRGEIYDPKKVGLKLLKDDIENDRYIEIWNIVFSEFNKDENSNYTELSQKNIDTGAGLERITSVMQEVPTNFDTDLFMPIINAVEKLTGKEYDIENYFTKDIKQAEINKHMKIIADHMRAITQAINDGAKPSNTQRGYIIRRLIRRAYRSGIQLGINDAEFLYKLIPSVQRALSYYPIDKGHVESILRKEELSFSKTIKQGEELLKASLKDIDELDFSIAFKLFETYGFPIELTQEIAQQDGVKLDISKFDEYQKIHAETSRGNKFTKGMQSQINIIQKIKKNVSKFIGYDALESSSKVIIQGNEKGNNYLLLDKTPFYATSGGQQKDIGTIDGIEVIDVFKDAHDNHWHITKNEVRNKEVKAIVDKDKRLRKARNHSGTHLLGHALRSVLGENIIQLGSDNNENRLRFDFPYDQKPTHKKQVEIENKVKEYIKNNIKREYIIDSFENGIKMGALALEGEIDSDPSKVSRIVKFGNSIEFCGGTHVENSSILQDFKITKIESKGSGTYRIEAITSADTIKSYENEHKNKLINELNGVIKKIKKFNEEHNFSIPNTIENLHDAIFRAKQELKSLMKNSSKANINYDIEFTKYNNMKAFIKLDLNPRVIKSSAIKLREEYPDALIILGGISGNRTTLVIASKTHNSKKIFDGIANKHNGRGGGNETFAMGSMDKINNI